MQTKNLSEVQDSTVLGVGRFFILSAFSFVMVVVLLLVMPQSRVDKPVLLSTQSTPHQVGSDYLFRLTIQAQSIEKRYTKAMQHNLI